MKKQRILLLLAGLLALFCGGCRVRVLGDPALADAVLVTTQPRETTVPDTEPPTTAPPETEAPVTEPPTLPPEPETVPETTEPPAEPPAPTPTQPPAPVPRETVPVQPGPEETGAGAAAPVPVPATEAPPVPTEATAAPETAPTLVLTLDDNGGDLGLLTLTVRPGEPYGPLPQATRRGWRFDGWWTDPAGGEAVLAETPVLRETDHTLYAHWAPGDSYTLLLDPCEGRISAHDSALPIRCGEVYGDLPAPIREGYDFAGWWTAPEGGAEILPDSVFTQAENQTLYAHWSYNAFAYWTYVLTNGNERRYNCQQKTVYAETAETGITLIACGLIDDTDSLNAAAYRDDPAVTDEWVTEKNPDAIVKVVGDLSQGDQARSDLAQRFPGKPVYLVTAEALGGGAPGLWARLALAQALYPEWYTGVDLDLAARELGLGARPLQ